MSYLSKCRLMGRVLSLTIVGSALLVSSANATILVNENFTHSDGDLVGQTPTPGPGDEWASHSGGTTNALQVVGNELVVNQAGGQDASSGFANQGFASTTYARFDFRLPSSTNSDVTNVDGQGLYFAHFRGGTGTSFRARIGILAPTTGDFILAVSDGSDVGGTGTAWATELSFDTTYRVVTSYDAVTEEAKLWLDPVNDSSTSISAAGSNGSADIYSYAFRQSNDYDGQQIVDNLVVATSFEEALSGVEVPEPASIALLFCSLACIVGRRTR